MKLLIGILCFILFSSFGIQGDFLSEQRKFERVRTAISEKSFVVTQTLKANGLTESNVNILIVAYKMEDALEIYAKQKQDKTYRKIATYAICAKSGTIGPKRKAGDYQVPEGFYAINRFNPNSSFYLSLGLNYPNASDRIKSTASDPGGDIFIHGSCVTIGCMPMTNDKIKEIYLYTVYARNNGQANIPVYVFPFRMTDENMRTFAAKYGNEPVFNFWKNIKTGYDAFEKNRKALIVIVDHKGDYVFK